MRYCAGLGVNGTTAATGRAAQPHVSCARRRPGTFGAMFLDVYAFGGTVWCHGTAASTLICGNLRHDTT